MDKIRQNDLVCQSLGMIHYKTIEHEGFLYVASHNRIKDAFTESCAMCESMIRAIPKDKADDFSDELGKIILRDGSDLSPYTILRSTPEQKVEAYLRALGKWEY